MTSTPATFRVTTISAMGNPAETRRHLDLDAAIARVAAITRQERGHRIERVERDLRELAAGALTQRIIRIPGNSLFDGARGVVVECEETVPERFTDEALAADLGSDSRGRRAEAEVLLSVPAEGRRAVWHDAWYSRNIVGGRFSDALRSAAGAYRRGDKLAGSVAPKLDPRA